jgi:hypothetical protein
MAALHRHDHHLPSHVAVLVAALSASPWAMAAAVFIVIFIYLLAVTVTKMSGRCAQAPK